MLKPEDVKPEDLFIWDAKSTGRAEYRVKSVDYKNDVLTYKGIRSDGSEGSYAHNHGISYWVEFVNRQGKWTHKKHYDKWDKRVSRMKS